MHIQGPFTGFKRQLLSRILPEAVFRSPTYAGLLMMARKAATSPEKLPGTFEVVPSGLANCLGHIWSADRRWMGSSFRSPSTSSLEIKGAGNSYTCDHLCL
jgi:hypothetical protein